MPRRGRRTGAGPEPRPRLCCHGRPMNHRPGTAVRPRWKRHWPRPAVVPPARWLRPASVAVSGDRQFRRDPTPSSSGLLPSLLVVRVAGLLEVVDHVVIGAVLRWRRGWLFGGSRRLWLVGLFGHLVAAEARSVAASRRYAATACGLPSTSAISSSSGSNGGGGSLATLCFWLVAVLSLMVITSLKTL